MNITDIENDKENQKILLIDIDNCPSEIEKIMSDPNDYTKIIVCYGGQIPKIPLSLIDSLAEVIYKKKLEIVGMKKKGKNAADFGLCFWAGRLSVQMPVGTEFTILSKDTDLDHAVDLLAKFGYKAERVGTVSENETPEILQQKTTESEVAGQYYQKLLNTSSPSRPATEDKLLNSIRSFCRNKCPGKEKAIFDILKEKEYFEVLISGKIQYK